MKIVSERFTPEQRALDLAIRKELRKNRSSGPLRDL